MVEKVRGEPFYFHFHSLIYIEYGDGHSYVECWLRMCHNRYIEYNEYPFMYFITYIYKFIKKKKKHIYIYIYIYSNMKICLI